MCVGHPSSPPACSTRLRRDGATYPRTVLLHEPFHGQRIHLAWHYYVSAIVSALACPTHAIRVTQRSIMIMFVSPPQVRSCKSLLDYMFTFGHVGGTGRIPLNNPKVIGVANSRGNRRSAQLLHSTYHSVLRLTNHSYQEDFYAFSALSLDPEELRLTLKKHHGRDWDPSALPETLARQVLFVGIYDGHGGSTVSQYLRQELHGFFESADKSHVPELFEWAKELGGYFKRFRGGVLSQWVRPNSVDAQRKLDLEARATLAFWEVCCNTPATRRSTEAYDRLTDRWQLKVRLRNAEPLLLSCFSRHWTIQSCPSSRQRTLRLQSRMLGRWIFVPAATSFHVFTSAIPVYYSHMLTTLKSRR